ncbi:substrate-binding domain-containing protein [Saccharopolyspora erythraea]|uniref:PstS family phosphate ABC transporter substrate-binding protein n=1 Tax=Saccharopolyspora erythraea TaxID=1836 RepID=UPI001BA7E53B|nr:substrate-binding domain-containing protein [Saccharopolyspora erythraea]QUH04940.1 substrate-binding domain-containing protein [Saccharopolyspora erythraea]
MDGIPWEIVFALLGVVVPIIAALYEFVFVGRKRLGYRVQMDTTATDAVSSNHSGALQELRLGENGERLSAPSFVLLRIENTGATPIDTSDYAVLDDDKVGIRVRFPGRRVAGMVVTELSDDFLRHSFGDDSGLSVRDDVIELPKVPLNRTAHYKVLAALDAAGGTPENFEDPKIVGGIKGGVGRGGIHETRSQTGTPRKAVALIGFLVLVILAQVAVSLGGGSAPLDCATGKLTVVGSTAFAPVLREAADSYRRTCPGAEITTSTRGSTAGLQELDREGHVSPGLLAFSDGAKGEGYPQLLPRPIAFSLFTLVVNREAGIQDLSPDQVRRLYAGEIVNWRQVGGNDQPVQLVSRFSDSGTRRTFEQRILDGRREPGDTSDDCANLAPGAPPGVVRCARASTRDVLDAVAATPGALGYSEVGAAAGRDDLLLVRIDGHPATLEGADYGAYPFWETEYAYTYGEPKADSLTASFLRYLTNEVGKDIVRSHGHRPCAELANPVLRRPS